MQLHIHTYGIELTEAIRRQASQKLGLALDLLEEDIERVSIYLVDTNGPFKGGIDKACRIVVQIRQQDSLVTEDIDADLEVVIDRVTDRLGVVVCQRVDSRRKHRHRFRRFFYSDD